MKKGNVTIEDIAREIIPAIKERDGLDERHNDSEDFVTVSVWSLRDALEAAYQAGRNHQN